MGSGFRTFQSGEVLTAANVQDYLMDQSVQVFAGTAALGSAIGTAVETGMVAYVQDTDQILHYRADTAHGTSWAGMPMRGGSLNAIINGGFDVWQRGTSFSNPASATYTSDRWSVVWDGSGTTRTISRQTFTPASAPLSGYEAAFFFRFNQSVAGSGATYNLFQNRMEDVRTFAGQTVTVSFWAKAATSTTLPTLNFEQNFGTGGSPSGDVSTDFRNNVVIGTTWTRYSFTTTVPSISGKTIGTTTPGYLGLRIFVPINATFTLDVWGVQVEAGSAATPFETEQLEVTLAKCQRYYFRSTANTLNTLFAQGIASSTTAVEYIVPLPVPMRVAPTSIEQSTLEIVLLGTADYAFTGLALSESHNLTPNITATGATGLTQNRPYMLRANNSTAAFLGFSAEL